MQGQPCTEWTSLSIDLKKAIQATFTVQAECALAAKEMRDTGIYATLLADVRAVEDRAVKALERHRKQHGC